MNALTATDARRITRDQWLDRIILSDHITGRVFDVAILVRYYLPATVTAEPVDEADVIRKAWARVPVTELRARPEICRTLLDLDPRR